MTWQIDRGRSWRIYSEHSTAIEFAPGDKVRDRPTIIEGGSKIARAEIYKVVRMIDGRGRIESTARVLAAAGKRTSFDCDTEEAPMRLSNGNNCDDRVVFSYDTCHAQSTRDWHISAFHFFLLTTRARDPGDSRRWRSLTERPGCASRSGYCTFNVASLGNIQDFGRKGCARVHSFAGARQRTKKAACIFHPRRIMESSLPTRSRLLFFDTWQKNTRGS